MRKAPHAGLAFSWLLLACGERAAAPPPAAPAAASAPERIVLVTIDTLRADHVGCYGARDAGTKTLDALAAEGVRFEVAIAPAPLTLPSHATLLTGLDPPEHGVRHNAHFRLRDEVPTLAEALRAEGFATAAFVSAFVLERGFGLARGFEVYDDALGVFAPGNELPGMAARSADRTVAAALAWLEQAPARFFLWLHLYDPHADYAPPEPFRSLFAGRAYQGEIAFADAELGKLLARVGERWPDAGTLVVATSDHGESLGEHGEPTHSLGVYEATQRVPLLMRGPGLPRGRAVAGVARLADVAPTILALAGLAALPGARGASLLPLVEGTEVAPRVAWVETLATQLDFGWSPMLGVRSATHKYVRAPRPELYDLARDPGEQRNRAAEEPALVAELDALVSKRAGSAAVVPNRFLAGEERARLEALGYVSEARAGTTPLGVVGGSDPKDERALLAPLFEAMTLLGNERAAEALAKLEALGPRGYDVELLRARAALAAGDTTLARRTAARAHALAPGPDPLVVLGRAAEAEGRDDAARAAFEQALALDAGHAAARVGLARLAERTGRRDEAQSGYEAALARGDAEAAWRLAALALEDGDLRRARELLALLPPRELRRAHVAARLARAEQQAGRSELARTRVAGALRAHPDDAELRKLAAELDAAPPR
jgi:arylsulfatase A-like enzyme